MLRILVGEKLDRKIYLELMRRCAILPRGIFGICENVPDEFRVVWKGVEYYPQAYTLEYSESGAIVHTCRLHDLKANAVVGAPLHEVEEKCKADVT